MDTATLIQALSSPSAYPTAIGEVEVRQTHISAVFLAGPCVFKVKKPVDLGFLDFSTLEKRRHFCEEEVRLNRRLAAGVYLGVVPITKAGGGLMVEGPGEAVEWAVKMRRLPDEATLEARLRRGAADGALMRSLARRVASFHAGAGSGGRIAECGRFEVVAGNARENYTQAAAQAAAMLGEPAFERLRGLNEGALCRLRPLIESRAARGVPRDTHGDMRLVHVYLFPERPPPEDMVFIDCIEFNERYRYADPVADMAFLVMELKAAGRGDLARAFAGEYFRASADQEGRALLPFYVAYRAAVRAKVEGFKSAEAEVPAAERQAALAAAWRLWLLALGELEWAGQEAERRIAAAVP